MEMWTDKNFISHTHTQRRLITKPPGNCVCVYLSHQMHDTLLGMFAAPENTDPRLQIASCVYFLPPGLNGRIVVLTH